MSEVETFDLRSPKKNPYANDTRTVGEVFDTLTDEQKEAAYYYIGVSYKTQRKRIVADAGFEKYYDDFQTLDPLQRKLCRRLIGMAADKGIKERKRRK